MQIPTRNKAQLAMNAGDHLKEGHSPPPILLGGNSGLTLEEVLTRCESLVVFIQHQIRDTDESHKSAQSGNGTDKITLHVMLDYFLGPNIAYLREIGRLPPEFTDLDPFVRFSLPSK